MNRTLTTHSSEQRKSRLNALPPQKRESKMKAVKKLVCAKAILFLMTASAAAQITTQTEIVNEYSGTFFTLSGEEGAVSVYRQNVGGIVTTNLYYSFCLNYNYSPCQEGQGTIPNSAFQGNISTRLRAPNTLTLNADTTISTMSNWLCYQPFEGECGSTSPATGGPIVLALTKLFTNASTYAQASNYYASAKLTSGETQAYWDFDATMKGTILGISPQLPAAAGGDMIHFRFTNTSAAAAKATIKSALAKRLGEKVAAHILR